MSAIFARFQRRARCRLLAREQFNAHFLACGSLILLAAIVFDAAAGHAGRTSSPLLFALASTFTRFGEADWSLISSLILVLEGAAVSQLARSARERCHALFISAIGVYVFLVIALSGLAANLLKRAIGRARPGALLDAHVFDFYPFAGSARFESFPSGHATTVGAVFMIGALLMPRYRLPLAVGAIWLGMTRVMVGAHYPSDVMAGLCFGAMFAWLMARVFARYGLAFRLDPSGRLMLRHRLQGTWRTTRAAAKPIAEAKIPKRGQAEPALRSFVEPA